MSNARIKIGLDWDETVLDHLTGYLRYHNLKYKTFYEKKDIHNYQLWKVLGNKNGDLLSCDELLYDLLEFYWSKDFLKLGFINGAVAGINFLKRKGYDLSVVTSRPTFIEGETRLSMERCSPRAFSGLHFARGHFSPNRSLLTKAEIFVREKFDIGVEDFPDNAAEIASKGIPVIVPRHPWNNYFLENNSNNNIYPADDWMGKKGIIKKIEEILG